MAHTRPSHVARPAGATLRPLQIGGSRRSVMVLYATVEGLTRDETREPGYKDHQIAMDLDGDIE